MVMWRRNTKKSWNKEKIFPPFVFRILFQKQIYHFIISRIYSVGFYFFRPSPNWAHQNFPNDRHYTTVLCIRRVTYGKLFECVPLKWIRMDGKKLIKKILWRLLIANFWVFSWTSGNSWNLGIRRAEKGE